MYGLYCGGKTATYVYSCPEGSNLNVTRKVSRIQPTKTFLKFKVSLLDFN